MCALPCVQLLTFTVISYINMSHVCPAMCAAVNLHSHQLHKYVSCVPCHMFTFTVTSYINMSHVCPAMCAAVNLHSHQLHKYVLYVHCHVCSC